MAVISIYNGQASNFSFSNQGCAVKQRPFQSVRALCNNVLA